MDLHIRPVHVALIADGNRRWAKVHHVPTSFGHERGAEAVERVVYTARDLGIQYFTVWGFSTENWSRAKEEIGSLMGLFERAISSYLDRAMKEKIRIVHLGRKDRFSDHLRAKLIDAEKMTEAFEGFTLCIALDYGGIDEIQRAHTAAQREDIVNHLDMARHKIPNIDLVIRTGGALRTSGFFPVSAAYAEWYFVSKMLPDFTPDDFKDALGDYASRQRRFGK
jgi:undecaprenyl diphosphate synthase